PRVAPRANRRRGPPPRPEGAEGGRGGGRGGEEGQMAREPRHFGAGGPPHRAVGDVEPDRARIVHVVERVFDAGELLIGGRIDLGEGTLTVLLDRGVHGGTAPAFAIDLEECQRLPLHSPELPP